MPPSAGRREVVLAGPHAQPAGGLLRPLGAAPSRQPRPAVHDSAELRAEVDRRRGCPDHAGRGQFQGGRGRSAVDRPRDPTARWAARGSPALQRGTRALLDEGIGVRVDLILGLPGDTVDSVRRGIEYLERFVRFPSSRFQPVDPARHGISRRSRVAGTGVPVASAVLRAADAPRWISSEWRVCWRRAQAALGVQFDAGRVAAADDQLPAAPEGTRVESSKPSKGLHGQSDPKTREPAKIAARGCSMATLRRSTGRCGPGWVGGRRRLAGRAAGRAQAFTLWLRVDRFFRRHRSRPWRLVDRLLADNPHTTLEVVWSRGATRAASHPACWKPCWRPAIGRQATSTGTSACTRPGSRGPSGWWLSCPGHGRPDSRRPGSGRSASGNAGVAMSGARYGKCSFPAENTEKDRRTCRLS